MRRRPGASSTAVGTPTALVGMLLFIASEVMFFGGLFADVLQRPRLDRWRLGPAGGRAELDLPLAAVLTAILVASSFTMQFGVWAIRRGDTGKLRMWTAITLGPRRPVPGRPAVRLQPARVRDQRR